MRHTVKRRAIAGAAASLLFAPIAWADDLSPRGHIIDGSDGLSESGHGKTTWSLKAVGGASFSPDYLGSTDYEVDPIIGAILNFSYDAVFVDFNVTSLKAGYRVSPDFDFGAVARYQGGRDDVENERVDKLDDIDDSAYVGAFFRAKPLQWLIVNGEITQDVTGATDGFIASLGVSAPVPLSPRWLLTPSIGMIYYSDNFIETSFGVNAEGAARSGLREFKTESGAFAFSSGLTLGYKITDHWSAGLSADYKRLTGDAADSPIVKDEGSADQARVSLGLSYNF